MEQEDALLLRKANKIKTIHSSLAIEGNTLEEGQVYDIMNGKHVVAPLRQIQEVKNAIATYELFPKLDAFKEKDLLKAHSFMMQALVDNAGRYRSRGVGVFSEQGCVHMAPPADRVPFLMADLFDWLRHSRDHLLIRSCVFHYEFEFIHPFLDGNGRMGRLWQSLILSKLNPLFEHLPVENMVYANQQQYYDAISASTSMGQSGPFIDFMLGEIQKTLETHRGEPMLKVPNKVPNKVPDKLREAFPLLPDAAWDIYGMLKDDGRQTSVHLAECIGISERMVKKYISLLKKHGLLTRIGSNKTGYWKTNL
ncbi:MAG: Fic family protein [Prevotella sp.]|nr:Fic family protein [Prevotella sp.]